MKRRRPEQQDHRAVVQHLQVRATPGTYWFHPANGGWRSKIEAAILKSLGVRAGTPDLILIHAGRTFGLELKSPAGRLSQTQIAAHEEMRRAGAEVAVAAGLDEAIEQLERWQLLRGRSSA
jgi:VRR-NUC domain